MGRKAALEENEFLEGTEAYKYAKNKILELEETLGKLQYQITKPRIKKVYKLLDQLNDFGMDYDIGKVNSMVLLIFLKQLDLNNCNEVFKKVYNMCFTNGIAYEINPVSYGYGHISIEELNDFNGMGNNS